MGWLRHKADMQSLVRSYADVTWYTVGLLHNLSQNDLGTQELPLVRGTSKHHSHACNWSIQCLMLHSDAQHFQTIPLIGSSNLIKRRSSGQLQDSVCPLWLRAEDCCHHAVRKFGGTTTSANCNDVW